MINLEGITISYGSNVVVENLHLSISLNTIHGLVGLNGSGKTTLLNTIYGSKRQDAGEVLLSGEKVKRNQMAFLETSNYFYPSITGLEYLNLFVSQNPSFNISEWNKLFELPLKKLIDTYSTGMKKKLAFMGVMCLNRPFIILDEPFNGVDMETVQKIKSLLLELRNQGRTILITSHILESLENICNEISYLNNKSIQFTMPRSEFNQLENEIFHLHQDAIDDQVKTLLGNSFNTK